MNGVNFFAVIVAAFSSILLGSVWYSPRIFGNIWLKESGLDMTQLKGQKGKFILSLSFMLSLISAGTFAYIVSPLLQFSIIILIGLVVGLGWMVTTLGINYTFYNRGYKLFLIDGGYHFIQFLLYGIIFGLWR